MRSTNSYEPPTPSSEKVKQQVCNEMFKSLISIENIKIKVIKEALEIERVISCSWDELTLNNRKWALDKATMLDFTGRHLLRCYPNRRRVTSQNFDPSLAWSMGAQMVALNFQTNDLAMWLNRGKFVANGGCGFVRKPEYLIDPSVPAPSEPTRVLTITIIAGSGWEILEHITHASAPQTYVRITIAGNVKDFKSCTSSVSTSHSRTSDAQPFFNETFEFHLIEPDLALVLFTVHDKSVKTPEMFLAQHCSPVNLLRSGTRISPLYSAEGTCLSRE